MPKLATFTGEFPKVAPHLLPETAAQAAFDCDFGAGVLTGIQALSTIANLPFAPKSLAPYVGNDGNVRMFAFPYEVSAARSPVANDAYKRFYWTDGAKLYVSRGDGVEGDPKSNGNYNRVGVPQPASAPTVVSSQTTFTIPGVTHVNFFRACETATGVLTDKTLVLANVTSQSAHRLSMTLDMSGLSCTTAVAPTTVLAFGMAEVGMRSIVMEGPAGATQGVAPIYATVYRAVDGGRYYCFVPFEAVYTAASGIYNGMPNALTLFGPVYWESPETGGLVAMQYIPGTETSKGGWFCSQYGASAPTFDLTNAGVSGVSSSPVIPIVVDLVGGGTATGVIRPGGKSTLPPILHGYDISLSIEGSTASLTWAYSGSSLQSRDYVATYVNTYGEEGAPSAPRTIEMLEGESVSLTIPTPSGSEYLPVTKYRWYRTATGASGDTQYLFVQETNTPSLTDTVKTEQLGEPLATMGYLPPEEGLRGLISLPNGILAAFKNNEIHFSEPYLPYAWKRESILTAALPIVDMCASENGFYVTTKGEPYFVSGVTPDAMAQMKLSIAQAGIGRGSIVNVGSTVVYASNDGLVALNGGQASLDLSFKFFDRATWRRLYGAKLQHMRLNAHDGMVVVWFADGTPGFMVTLDESAPAMSRLKSPIYAAAVHPQRDALWVVINTTAYEFAAGSTTTAFEWWSKDFISVKPVNFGALQLVGSGSVTVTVFADGVQRHQETTNVAADGTTVLRLPAGFLASSWSVRLAGEVNAVVRDCTLAMTQEEIRRG